jgi:uncharacterized protein (DUF4415 family)
MTRAPHRPINRHNAAEALIKPAKKVTTAPAVERRALPNVKEPVLLKRDSDVLADFQATMKADR